MTAEWIRTADRRPELNQRVDWIAPGGGQVDGGTYAGGLVWFLPGNDSMYVYYIPAYWRPAKEEPQS